MTKRRSRGDGGLHWDEKRQRWIATANLGFDPSGKRIVKRGSGKTKTEAKTKLKEVLRDHEDGLAIAPTNYTVKDAVADWLEFGLAGLDPSTVETVTLLSRNHVIPSLGARKLRDLSAEDVDRWLATKSKTLSTRTLQGIHSCLNRAVKRAMARDKVKRNVVELCSVPQGQAGRPSKALTFAQAEAVLKGAEGTSMYAYIVVALLTGARTEELRALTWDHVFLKGRPDLDPPQPPHIAVWRSVRRSGDTKTRKSRRTLALPARCVDALWQQFEDQGGIGSRLMTRGRNTASSSRRPWASRSMPPTSAAPSARRSRTSTGSTPRSGRRGSSGTASCPCSPTGASRWKRSRGSSGTPGRPSPRRSTGSRSGP